MKKWFEVTLLAEYGSGERITIATDEVQAGSAAAAEERMYDDYWDPRLDSGDCTPVFVTEELKTED